MPPHEGQDIKKCGRLLMIPSSLLERELTIRSKGVPHERHQAVKPHERHQAVKPQEQWGSPLNRQIRPLSLRLQTSLRAALLGGLARTSLPNSTAS
jgi:hypothetical protein